MDRPSRSPHKRRARKPPRTRSPKRPAPTPEARLETNSTALSRLAPRSHKRVQCAYGDILVEALAPGPGDTVLSAVAHQLLGDADTTPILAKAAELQRAISGESESRAGRTAMLQRAAEWLSLSVELYEQEEVAAFHPAVILYPAVVRVFYFQGKAYGVWKFWPSPLPHRRRLRGKPSASNSTSRTGPAPGPTNSPTGPAPSSPSSPTTRARPDLRPSAPAEEDP